MVLAVESIHRQAQAPTPLDGPGPLNRQRNQQLSLLRGVTVLMREVVILQ